MNLALLEDDFFPPMLVISFIHKIQKDFIAKEKRIEIEIKKRINCTVVFRHTDRFTIKSAGFESNAMATNMVIDILDRVVIGAF